MKPFQPLSKSGLVLLCAFIFASAQSLFAQTTITIGPGTAWQDALIRSENPDYNYATTSHFAAYAWTASGNADYKRTLLKVGLSSIPADAVIQSATLYLYSDPTVTSSTAWNGNSQHSGSNAVYFEKVTRSWKETSLTWNNQPPVTTSGRIWFPPSTSTTENIQVDITSFVQSWVNEPASNFGLRMKLENEAYYRSRTYASENHSNTSIRPKLVVTYSIPSGDPVSDKLDYMFSELDKSQVPTGFLEEYGGAFLPLDVFNGVLTDSNRVNMDVWRMTYASLHSSRIYGTNPLPDLGTVNNNIKNARSSTSAIPVVMLHARYGHIKENAFDLNLLNYDNGKVKDVAGRTESPYAERNLFIASPAKNYSNDGSVSLVFRNDLFYNPSGKSVQSAYVDFADGRGYVAASWNTPVSATYSSAGLKLIKIKVIFSDNSQLQCYSQINVKSVLLDYPGEEAHETVRFDGNDFHSGGEIFIAYGENNDGSLDKPLIVVEGYDASTISEELADPYNYERLIRDLNNQGAFNFNDELDMAGYDLVFLNYNDGTDDIRRNAALFEEVVEWVNDQKRLEGSTEKNVVMGISMGGLVARYGLARMTKDGRSTGTRLLITHDSPHRGANVPLGFQHLFSTIPRVIIRGNQLLNISETLQNAVELFNAPATRQMLILRSEDGLAVQNTFLENVYRPMVEFNAGDPESSYDFIATSQGSECGNQIFEPYTELARGDGEFYVAPIPWITRPGHEGLAIINALPSPNASNRRITYVNIWHTLRFFWVIKTRFSIFNINIYAPSNVLPWDGAPGGTFNLNAESPGELIHWGEFLKLEVNAATAGEFSFVPLVSALDISEESVDALSSSYVNGISPEYPTTTENFIAQNRVGADIFNINHTTFTARNAEWIYNEMENIPSNNLNCSSECQPTGVAVEGSPTVCDTEMYTINVQFPEGSSISWASSANLTYVSGQGTSNFTVQPSSSTTSGTAWVEAVYNLGCGDSDPIRKELWVGKPGAVTTDPNGSSTIQLVPGQTKTVYATSVPGASSSSLNWWISGGSGMGILSKGSNNVVVEAYYSGYYYLNVTSRNSCGESVTRTIPFEVSDGGGGGGLEPMTVYPNPNRGVFTVEIDKGPEVREGEKFRIIILDNSNNMIYEKYTTQRKVSLNLQHTRKGWYYLLLQYKQGTLSRKIKIE
jgi:hypothetical protein